MARVHKVAAAHAAPVFMDAADSVEKACGLIRSAAAQGNELVVFPEVYIPGFPYWINLCPPAVQKPLIARYHDQSIQADGPEIGALRSTCAGAGIAAVVGFSERSRGGRTCYNSQAYIDRDGTLLGVHRKLQPTNAERMVWGQGDGSTLKVWPAAIGRLGGLVCWEHTMNLARQALVVQGIEIHAASWPSLSTLRGFEEIYDIQVESLMRAHCLSGQCFTITAQSPTPPEAIALMDRELGPQGFMTAGGGWSAIHHPFCRALAGPHLGPEETIVSATIDLDDLRVAKVSVCGAGHYARSEILSLVIDDEPKEAVIWRSKAGPKLTPGASGESLAPR